VAADDLERSPSLTSTSPIVQANAHPRTRVSRLIEPDAVKDTLYFERTVEGHGCVVEHGKGGITAELEHLPRRRG